MRVDNHSDYYLYRDYTGYGIFRIISGRTGITNETTHQTFHTRYQSSKNRACVKDIKHSLINGKYSPKFISEILKLEMILYTARPTANLIINYEDHINYYTVKLTPTCSIITNTYNFNSYEFCPNGCHQGRCLTPAESLELGSNYA